MQRIHNVAVLVLLAVASSGCACFNGFTPCHGLRCESSGGPAGCGILPCGGCDAGGCGDCGQEVCSCAAAPADCQSCAAADCQSCATPAFSICRPNLLHAIFGCTGCDGELYWSEWFNDPPACCDPCDEHGNWIGHGTQPVAYASVPPGMGVIAGPVVETPGCPCGQH